MDKEKSCHDCIKGYTKTGVVCLKPCLNCNMFNNGETENEGWTQEHDKQHIGDGLVLAVICYVLPEKYKTDSAHTFWPWEKEWWKPTPDDRIRELAKAGALIAAEIDRSLAEGEKT